MDTNKKLESYEGKKKAFLARIEMLKKDQDRVNQKIQTCNDKIALCDKKIAVLDAATKAAAAAPAPAAAPAEGAPK